jgi:hypothetical protein
VGPSLFRTEDIKKFAEDAGLSISGENHVQLAQGLMKAFLNAHTAQEVSKQIATAGQRREAYANVAKAGRTLLATLGCDPDDLSKLASLKGRYALDASSVLRELARDDGESSSTFEQLTDLPRVLAGLFLSAERARVRLRKRSPSGPVPGAFSLRLLDGLVDCYRRCFSRWPATKRKDGERQKRPGPGVRWVRAVLREVLARLERQSIDSKPGDPGVSPRFANEDRLKANLRDLLANSDATLEGQNSEVNIKDEESCVAVVRLSWLVFEL